MEDTAPPNGFESLLAPLPELREELTLHPGPPGGDGSPTWSLQDPVRNLFFRIDWTSFEILSRWSLGTPIAVAEAVTTQTTLDVGPEDVFEVVRFLTENELLRIADAAGSQRFAAIAQRRKSGWARWLLHHYLFFRVPLIRPDSLLERLSPLASSLFTSSFIKLTLAVLAIGLIEVARQWETFSATLIDTFSWQGLMGYGLALIFVKILHEFGHALMAKRFGCRVPVMGVAFLVMWPMAYTDVNETWKLPDRRRRLLVSGAGILTELVLAAWATLAWALMPEGPLKGAMFLLATTTWVSTLAINASPFLRFDGYFLLCDWLDMPNLHQRAFALARWRLRESLFGLGDPVPEHLPKARHKGLIVFAFITWLYRLVIFLGIAVLVYEFFVKLLGLFLFIVEIVWFIAIPIWSELKVWWQRRADIRVTARSRRTAWLAGALMVLAIIPWRLTVESQGMLRPTQSYAVITPAGARVAGLPHKHLSTVAQGDELIRLESPELALRQANLRQRLETLSYQARAATVDDELKSRRLVFMEELAGVEAQLTAIEDELRRLRPLAPFDGVLLDLPPDVEAGQWLPRNTHIATLARLDGWRVETFLPEAEVARIGIGYWGRFITETAGGGSFWLKVERIDEDASRSLPEPMLAATRGGQILAREKGASLVPDHAMYRVTLRATGQPEAQQILRGKVIILGNPTTLAAAFLRSTSGLLIREAGF
ncbi:site-2 protease family protein [Azonexus hydrophilus]|uniref:site-2 protease family protein n=1 Tax=Azonexus hydrophilus TaxID=418702 RepID=UPI000420FE0D|nr:site-2 protease family protein [Azonexus hydrophilus]